MPHVVKISTGTEVTLKDRFTHKADKAYAAARDKGAVEKEYLSQDIDPQTKKSGSFIVIERPLANSDEANDAALLLMIARVKNGETESDPTQSWLDELDESDHALLMKEMVNIRKEGQERGKKSR